MQSTILVIGLAGLIFPAFGATITFDEVSTGTVINGQTIKNVLFTITSTPPGDENTAAVASPGFDPSNMSGPLLNLGGGNDLGFDTLTLDFLNGPISSFQFSYAVSGAIQHIALSPGSLTLYDVSLAQIGAESTLSTVYNTPDQAAEGTFTYSGSIPISRAVMSITNVFSEDANVILDTITFQAVPEPSTFVLCALALGGLIFRRWFTRSLWKV